MKARKIKVMVTLTAIMAMLAVVFGVEAAKQSAPPGQIIIKMSEFSNWYFLTSQQRSQGVHNTQHSKNYSDVAPGYNKDVIKGIDKVMATAAGGGGYFVGLNAIPPESPVGYELKLGGYPLLMPSRKSSYCSGSSYAVFIETLNSINPLYYKKMTTTQLEAVRMQEQDGSRRDDDVKLWGYWNDDFWGIHHAMIDYTKTGTVITPDDARPGDFLKIMWGKTSGHFVVFLGWINDGNGKPAAIRYWSSQPGTNGFGEQESAIGKIYSIMFVRLTKPDNITRFDPAAKVNVWSVTDAGYILK